MQSAVWLVLLVEDKGWLSYMSCELAGIPAGVWPCGTIMLLAELYISESKCQVYGSVHGLLHEHPMNTASISK